MCSEGRSPREALCQGLVPALAPKCWRQSCSPHPSRRRRRQRPGLGAHHSLGSSPQPPELTCPSQSQSVGSGHTQLGSEQLQGPWAPMGRPSATPEHSQALPRQVKANTFPAQHWRVWPLQKLSVGRSSRAEALNVAWEGQRCSLGQRQPCPDPPAHYTRWKEGCCETHSCPAGPGEQPAHSPTAPCRSTSDTKTS